jgi:hypothetical protein
MSNAHLKICREQRRKANKRIAALEAELAVLNKLRSAINEEYIKTWDVLRTYNPKDIELEYIGFETIEEGEL